MDDSCAVCADSLEWVAYGPCGHREVCSTCVARLRFICDDNRCCICKTDCNFVFVTKALGDYTRMVSDFSSFPKEPREGRTGPYWYHEDTQAFFDDADHYRMIKAMCRLSCSICDKAEEEQQQQQQQQPGGGGGGGFRKRQRFRNIGQLKGHLSHQHRMFMCDLCLEGRKVFICEQKLYTRPQLNQHKRTGDSEVDGTESERGGFAGHPMCEFCRSHFYGENELYSHMSTEHYTCHICQRRHPGQHEYYRDYDDLETHFRQGHFLCEDEACLAKKFTVFQTEAELKRHNALEHGGRMSRSQRNAVLQIPTSFRYRSNNESGRHRGPRRPQSFRRESSPDNDLSMAIQASLERVSTDNALPDASSSAAAPLVSDESDARDIDPLVQPFESLNTTDSEPSSRYRQAVSQSSITATLGDSSFPPLSGAPSSQQRTQEASDDSNKNTMAARLLRQNNANVLNVARPTPARNRGRTPASPNPWPGAAPASSNPWTGPASASSSEWPVASPLPAQTKPATTRGTLVLASGQTKPATANSSGSSLQARPEPGLSVGGSWATRSAGSSSRLNHSSSSPNLIQHKSFDAVSDFPPVSAVQPNRLQSSGQTLKTEGVQTANKSLVERIRTALDFDENKYGAFKQISQEYRQGLIDTWEYLEYVKQFDLTHLVPDLANLCPDVQKRNELTDAYSAMSQNSGPQETFWGNGIRVKASSSSKKDKGKKLMDSQNSNSKDTLADNMINTVRSLQSQMKPLDGEVEFLEKDGYRATKGKSTIIIGEKPAELRETNQHISTQLAGQPLGDGGGVTKQKKKTSKFHRVRLGDSSSAAILDVRNSLADPTPTEMGTSSSGSSGWPNPSEGLPRRGVWGNGGTQRLFAK